MIFKPCARIVVRQHGERLPHRRRVGVVAVVHDRDAVRQAQHLAAMRRGLQLRRAIRDRLERHVELERDGRCREHVREVAASHERRADVDGAARGGHPGARAVDPAVDDRGRADVGGPFDPERHDAARKRSDARADALVVRVGDQQRRRIGALEDLRLGVGNVIDRVEEADGAIVGSSIVKKIEEYIGKPELVSEVAAFAAGLKE